MSLEGSSEKFENHKKAAEAFLSERSIANLEVLSGLLNKDKKYAKGVFREIAIKHGLNKQLITMAVLMLQDKQEAKAQINLRLGNINVKQREQILSQLAELKQKATDKEVIKILDDIAGFLPSKWRAQKNQEKAEERKRKMKDILSETLTSASKPYLLPVTDLEFSAAEKYFKENQKETKLPKYTKYTFVDDKDNKHEIVFSCSFVNGKIKGKPSILAIANGEYLGEGAYGRVKLAQDKDGRNYAAKIEGKGSNAEEEIEKTISTEVGLFRGEAILQYAAGQEKRFKGKDTGIITVSILELKQGKELFQHLYTNVLTPGQIYTKEEQEPLRKEGGGLKPAQQLITAFKCCEAVSNLHNRGIVHGDLKPANFMVDARGNRILVGSIDHGFSFTLAPGEKVIKHPGGIPRGTHERYMPQEVLKGKAKTKTETADFSAKSDIYSLGVMFRDDFTVIPDDITNQMLQENAEDRKPLPEIMLALVKKLKELPENEQDEEVKKIIAEFESGVKRMKEDKGPQIKLTFVAQLMSGYRDPRVVVGESTSTMYTTQDFKNLATLVFTQIRIFKSEVTEENINVIKLDKKNSGAQKLGAREFFKQLKDAYNDLKDTDDKICFMQNAEIFIKELIDVDINNEFSEIFKSNIDELNKLIQADVDAQSNDDKEKLSKRFSIFKENIDGKITEHEKSFVQREEKKGELQKNITQNGEVDIQQHIRKDLANPIIGLGKKREFVNEFADYLYNRNLNLIQSLKLEDVEEKKLPELNTRIQEHLNPLRSNIFQDLIFSKNKHETGKVFEFYAQVAHECIERGDLTSAQEIISCLQSGIVIDRLKECQLDIPKSVSKMFNEDAEIFSPLRNNKNYHDHVKESENKGKKVLPALSIFSGELFKFYDKNSGPQSGTEIIDRTKDKGPEKDNESLMEMIGKWYRQNIFEVQSFEPISFTPKTNIAAKLSAKYLNVKELEDAAIALRDSKKKPEKSGKDAQEVAKAKQKIANGAQTFAEAKKKYENLPINQKSAEDKPKVTDKKSKGPFGVQASKFLGKLRDKATPAKFREKPVAQTVTPIRTVPVSSVPDANQKYFAECFGTLRDHANTLQDENLEQVFNSLKSNEKYKESSLVENGQMIRIPKIGELYEVGWPYSSPNEKFKARGEQIIIDAFKAYKPTDTKIITAGSCMEQLNTLRTYYDMILMTLRNEGGLDEKSLYDSLSSLFSGYEKSLNGLSQNELMKNNPYLIMHERFVQIKNELLNLVGTNFKAHFEQWKVTDKEREESITRRLAERQNKVAAAAGGSLAVKAGEQPPAPPPPPPAPTEQAAREPKAPPTKEQRQLALEKAKNIGGRKAISKPRKRAEAVGQKEKPQLPGEAEKFDNARAMVFLQGFTNQYQPLQISTDNESKSEIAKLEKKLIGFSVHPDKTIREMAFKLLDGLSILGKPQSSYVKQLLSGFKDPTTFDPKNPAKPGEKYTEEELVTRAFSLLQYFKPDEFLKDLVDIYESLPIHRVEIIKNAELLLETMIQADHANEFFTTEVITKIQQFVDSNLQRPGLSDKEAESLRSLKQKVQQAVAKSSENIDRRNTNISSHRAQAPNAVDAGSFIKVELANPMSDMDIETKAKLLASDLRGEFVALYLRMKPTDFYGQAWSKPRNKDVERNAAHASAVLTSHVAQTIAEDILHGKSINHQKQIVLFYTKALEYALNTGDYSTANSINMAFGLSAIARLTYLTENPNVKAILDRANFTFAFSNRSENYRKAISKFKEEHKEIFPVPILNNMLTDITMTDENKDKKQDPINNRGEIVSDVKVKLMGKIYQDHEHIIQDMLAHPVAPRQTSFVSRLHFVDENLLYDISEMYAPRGTIKLDEIESLPNLLNVFPKGKLPYDLKVTLQDKNFTDKDALKKLLEVALPLFLNVTLVDKIHGSKAHHFLRDLVDNAKAKDLYEGKIKEACDAAVKGIEPVGHEINTLMALSSYDDAFQLDYFSAAKTVRATMRERFNTFKSNVTEPSMVAHLKNITSDLDIIDKFSTLQANFMLLKAGYDDVELETAPIEKIYKSVLDLTTAENEANSKLKSSNPAVKKAAQDYLETIREEFASDFINNITEMAIRRLNEVVNDYQLLLMDRAQLKAQSQPNEAILKDISTNLESLYKGCHALSSKSEEAKNALKTIDSFVAIDKLMKDTSKGLDEKAKNIYPYLVHENPQISDFAEKMCSFEILEKISEIREQEQAFLNTFADEFDKLVANYLELQDKAFDDASLNITEGSITQLIKKLEELSNSKFEDVKDKADQIKAFHKPVLDAFNEIQKHKVIMNQNKDKAAEKSPEESKIARLKRSLSSYKAEEASLSDFEKKYKELFNNIQVVHQQPKFYQLQSLERTLSEALTPDEKDKTLADILNLLDKMPSASSEKDKLVGKIVNEFFLDNMPKDDIAQKINYLNNKVAELEAKMKGETNPQYSKFYAKAISQFKSEINDLTYLRGTKKWRVGKGLPDKLITPDFQASIVLAVNTFNKDKEKTIAISANEISIIAKHLQQIANNPNSLAKDEAQASLEKIKEMLANPENFEVLKECIVKKHVNIGLDYKKENVKRVIKDLGFEKLSTDSDAEISRKESGAGVYQELLETEDSYLSIISKNNPDAVLEKFQPLKSQFKQYGFSEGEIRSLVQSLNTLYKEQRNIREEFDSASPDKWALAIKKSADHYVEYTVLYEKIVRKMKDGDEKKIQDLFNKIGINFADFITGVQRPPRYVMLLKELGKYAQGEVKAQVNKALMSCKEMVGLINKRVYESEIDDLANKFDKNPTEERFAEILSLLSDGAAAKTEAGQFNYSDEQLKSFVNRLDFSKCSRKYLKLIQELKNKDNTAYKATDEKLLPLLIHKISNDRVIAELKRHMTEVSFVQKLTPFQRDLFTHIFVAIDEQAKHQGKIDIQKAVTSVKAKHQSDATATVTSENALKPFNDLFNDLIDVQHKYRPWKIKDLENATVNAVLQGLAELRGDKKAFGYNFPNYTKNDIVQYLVTKINAEPMLPLAQAHEALGHLSQVFGLEHNSKERNEILKAYSQRINELISEPYTLMQSQKTNLVTFFSQIEYLYKLRTLTPAQLKKTPALLELHNLFKNYNKVDMVLQVGYVKIELGTEFKKDVEQRKAIYEGKPVLSAQAQAELLVKNEIEMIKRVINGSRSEPSTFNKIRGLLSRSFKEINSPAIDTVYANFFRNISNMRNMLVNYKVSPNEDIRRLAEEELQKVDAEIQRVIADHPNVKMSQLLRDILPPVQSHQALAQPTEPPGEMSVMEALLSVSQPLPQRTRTSSSATAKETAKPHREESQERRRALTVGHSPSGRVEELLVQDVSSLNSIIHFFEKEVEVAGNDKEIVKDQDKLNVYGIDEIVPPKIKGNEDHITIKMRKTNPTEAAQGVPVKPSASETVDVIVGPGKKGGMEYNSRGPLPSTVIMNLCKLVVDSAEPGDKFKLPTVDSAQNREMKEALLRAIKARCEREKIPFKEGSLEIPENAKSPSLKQKTPKFGGVG